MGAPEGVRVYVKLESENPGGSIKDRLAYGIIEFAEKVGSNRDEELASHSKLLQIIFRMIFACSAASSNLVRP
jgi:threonine synthase